MRHSRLRSLYFLLAGLINRFIYLKTGLAFILAFVGTKMLLGHYITLPNSVSLLVVLAILAITITISMIVTNRRNRTAIKNEVLIFRAGVPLIRRGYK